MDTQTNRPQGLLPLGIGLFLWGLSGLLTVFLFVSLAGEPWWRQAIAVLWAFGLEGTKILCWKLGGTKRLLATFLVGLTLFSAWALSVASIEARHTVNASRSIQASRAYQEQLQSVDGLQRQITALVVRLEQIPPDYVSAARLLVQEIRSLRTDLGAAQAELTRLETTESGLVPSDDAFEILAQALGLPRKGVVLVIVLGIAVLTEVSALTLVGHRTESIPRTEENLKARPDEDDYLRIALDHPRSPRLLGRLEVARRLGIHENQARMLLETLVRQGRIKRGPKSFVVQAPKPPPKPPTAS